MITILDKPPVEVQKNLNDLVTDLDAKIPSKKLDKNLLIASWNKLMKSILRYKIQLLIW